ncbi:hypothetical protein [Bacteroides reticulotermitis]|uniref:hypothetical protein n=1 Tax=Bacteroides reticulotermitis TaxID=1133319 RepID=UPI003A85462E
MKLADYKIRNEMRAILLKKDEIVALVSDKVSPVLIPEETQGDAVYYGGYGLESSATMHGIVEYKMHVCYSVVSANCDRMNELAWLIVEELSGEYSNPYMNISVADSDEDEKDGKFIKTIDFLVKW